jgi:ankyrin repeat protein
MSIQQRDDEVSNPASDSDSDSDNADDQSNNSDGERTPRSSQSPESPESARSSRSSSSTLSNTSSSLKNAAPTPKKAIRRVDRSDFAAAPDAWAANDKPIHSIKCVTSNKRGVYKLPMNKEQNDFADGIFKDYVSRDILGLSEKHADAAETKRIAKARADARRAAFKAFIAMPCTECSTFYKRKKKEYKLYRAGFRKVTNSRRRNFFRFCAERQVAKIRQYIKSGHPVDDLDPDGRTGMHHGASEGHAIVIRELLKRGAEVDSKERLRNATPFWYCALRGNLATGELLIKARCDVDHRDAVNQQTPLMLCAIGNFLAFAERLIDEGSFLTFQDSLGMTPLHHAAFHGNVSMVFLLLEADHEVGGSKDVRDHAGNLPLDWAYTNKHRECAKLLRFGLDNEYMDDDEYLYW